MGSILTPATLAAKWQAATLNFNTIFQQTVLGVKPMHDAITTTLSSDSREEVYPFLDRIPQMREWLGERRVNGVAGRMQSLINKKYENTLAVLRTDIEDDKIGLYAPRIQMLAQTAAVLPETLVAEACVAGTSATVYDGQYYFDTDHPVNMEDGTVTGAAGAVVQANLLTSHALSAANLQDAIQIMMSYVGADGLPLNLIPDLLVVPPQLTFQARLLLHSTLIGQQVTLTGPTYGAAAQSNVLNGVVDLMVWPRLMADATSWYLMCTKSPIKPFIYVNRMPPEFSYLANPTDPNVFWNDELVYGVRARGVAGYGFWPTAIKCTA